MEKLPGEGTSTYGFFGELLELTCEEKLVDGEHVGADYEEELANED